MKIRKKAWSILLAIALIFTTLFGNYSVQAATVQALDTDTETLKTFTIHVKRPLPGSSGAAIYGYDLTNIYSYYRVDENNTVELSKEWPGDYMRIEQPVEDGTWYKLTYKAPVDSIRVIVLASIDQIAQYDEDGNFLGIKYKPQHTFPEDKGLESGEDNGFLISGEVWFDPLTMEEPVTANPDITPTPEVTETPPATTSAKTSEPTNTPESTPTATDEPVSMPSTEPVSGPQAVVDKASGTTYYQEASDYLDVTVYLANGATSAEVSVDNGPVATITEPTKFKVGTGKLANSMITLTVTSTDGVTTNTQHFYYYKRTRVETPSQAGTSTIQVSSAMVTLFKTVKVAALGVESTYTVNFTIPDDSASKEPKWTASDSKIYAYAYYNIYDGSGNVNGVYKPLGVWPGTEMTKLEGKESTYTTKVTTSTGEVTLMFVCVKGEVAPYPTQVPNEQGQLGEAFRVCDVIAQYPSGEDGEEVGGYTITKDTDFNEDVLATAVPSSSPDTSHEVTGTPEVTVTTPAVSQTPEATVSTPDVSQTPEVTEPTEVPEVTPEVKELSGYFGASLAGPQYNTTTMTLKAVAKNVQGKAKYTFAVNGDIKVDNGESPVYTWDPSNLKAGNYTITTIITDSATNKSITLDKVYPITEKTEAGDITPEPIIPTATPIVETPTVAPTAVVTAPPVVVTTAPAIATSTPVATQTATVTSTAIATIPAVTATEVPPVQTEQPLAPATEAPLTGKISFSKASNKATAGETVQIVYSQTNEAEEQDYTFTYKVKKGTKTTTLKSNTSKDRVSWTPTSSGTYQVTVITYDEAKNVVCTTKVTYKVKKRVITLKSFRPQNIKKGKKVTISVGATSSSGKLQYKVVIKNSKGKIVKTKAYSKKNKFTWKPTAKGTYKATIYLKNGKGVIIAVTKTIKVK